MAFLKLTEIHKKFDDTYSLGNINFSLTKGEVLCFLGPSGCGKTTLLRIIAGLERPDGGTVHLEDQNITEMPVHKRNFGMMFQEYALFPHMNVAQNIAFGMKLQKKTSATITTRVSELLELVGLSGFEKRGINDLSGGERQRVALARSLAPQPRLLMLDEPLAALDRGLRERLATDLRNILTAVGVTSIFVTHDQSEAFAIADNIAIFCEGNLEQLATPEKLYTSPVSEKAARFLGFQNIIPVQESFCSQLCVIAQKISQQKAKMLTSDSRILIRPEGAVLSSNSQNHAIHISGRIEEKIFLGQNYQLVLRVDGNKKLRFLLPLFPVPPHVGEKVSIAVPESAFVLL